MKFKAQPNLFVRISNKHLQRLTGKKGFYFDENGEYETDIQILANALMVNFEVIEETKEEKKQIIEVEEKAIPFEEMPEEQIRELAKEKKIKNWHNKKIDTLILELKEES